MLKKKRIFWALVVLLGIGLGVFLYYAFCILGKQPILQIDHREIDFGAIPSGVKVKKAFRITNTGNANLVIRRVPSGCGRLEVNLLNNIIVPGGSESLSVTVSAEEFGSLTHIFLFSNDPHQKILDLTVKATPVMKSLVEPSVIDFGQVEVETLPVTKSIKLSLKQDYFTDLNSDDIRFVIENPYLQVDSSQPSSDNIKEVKILLKKSVPIGDISTKLQIADNKRTANVRIFGSVRGSFFALPQMIILGPVNPQDGIISKNITLKMREPDDETLNIISFNVSNSLKNVISVSKKHSVDNTFEVVFDPNRYRGVWASGELDGYLEVTCSAHNITSQKINIPILVILKIAKIRDT